jgi:hypothetical protein
MCPEHVAPPPAKLSEPRPSWPALSSRAQAAPNLRLALPLAREAFQVLGPGRASPEPRDHPRRTSVARRRAWTELSGKPFSNSLHPRLPYVTPGFKDQSRVHLIHAPKKTTYIITECIEMNVIKHQSIYYIAEDLLQNKIIIIKRTKDR